MFMQKIEWLQQDDSLFKDLPENFPASIEKYRKLMAVYECAIREVNTKLENLDKEMEIWGNRNPIQYISHRIKKPRSIMAKMKRKGLPVDTASIWENINDVAGMRVVCSYLEDIYAIADMLTRQDDVFLLERKDYIKNPKPSGYRSLHLIIETPVFFSNVKQMVKVEIQIRTIAMDFWASLEHQLRYKTGVDIPESIREELNRIAENIHHTDIEMQNINQQIQQLSEPD